MSIVSSNQVIFDNAGKPSIMVRIPKFNLSDVIEGAPDTPHPAFIVNGAEVPEIWISKYQNVIVDERAYSLPYQEPAVNMTYDEARTACEAKGPGWHLMSNAEWAAIALWAKKNGTLPRGNNNWGSDYSRNEEKGVPGRGSKVLTGSGPASWSHDGTAEGVYDLNGNVWEWVSGLRLYNGEIQIIPDNQVAKQPDQSKDSEQWTPVLADGKIVKYTESENGVDITVGSAKGYAGCQFMDLKADFPVPDFVKALALFPSDNAKHQEFFWMDTEEGEALPLRGGSWDYGSLAGVFALFLAHARSYSNSAIGFRSAFIAGI